MINLDSETPAADRFRIGDCTITLSSRAVVVEGARLPRRLTPKALGVLRVLMRVPGAVVTREELFAEVWPDTLPTNDVLTQAITQLRKAFSRDDEAGTAYIETIAKSGYRLLQPVTALVEPVADADAAPNENERHALAAESAVASPVPRPRSHWRRTRRHVFLAIGLAMAVALLVLTALLLQRPAQEHGGSGVLEDGSRVVGSPQRPYRLITATAGFETYPTVSPDGSQVAYEADDAVGGGSAIKVQTSGNAPARLLADTPSGHSDRFPNWSPNGRDIAFARFGPDASCEVLIASATGGAIRHVTRCDGTELLSFDWTPDGRRLVFGSLSGRHAHRGIRVLDIASGAWAPIDYPMADDGFDYAPRFSPDSRWIVFVRNPQIGDLWRMPAAGGVPEQLTNDSAEIRGWAWRGDSRHIVFGRRVDSEARLYELDTQTRTLRDVGLDDAQSPALSRSNNMLAFVHRKAQFGLFRVPVKDGRPGTPERLFPSNGRDGQPMLAPDGRQLVFTSDRSGNYGLWWADLSRPESLRPVDGLRPETRQSADWSPDSTRLLVSGRDAQARPVIYEVSPRDEQIVALPVPVAQPLQALYAGDNDHLLVVERDEDERMRLLLFDRRATPWKLLGHVDGVSQARLDPANQRVLFTRLAAGGLWSADLQLAPASIQQVSEDRPSRWRYRTWAVARDGSLDYLSSRADCSTVFARINGPSDGAGYCLDTHRLSAGNGFSAQPDGSALYLALAVTDGADIGVMTLPEPPRPVFSSAPNLLFWQGK